MPVRITFQGPDYSGHQDIPPHDLSIDVLGFDLDYGCVTVYIDDGGLNHTLAVPAPMCNEEGLPLGEIGWRIEPSNELTQALPAVRAGLGLVFGRVIVTAGGMAVDERQAERHIWTPFTPTEGATR